MAGRWRDGIQSGDRASQPAFGDVAIGTLYFVTDEGVLERSTGAAWVEVAINETAHDALDHTGITGVGGSLGAWTGYTPTLTGSSSNPVLGSSTISGRYKLLDANTGIVTIELRITTGGSWNAGSGRWIFSLPAGWTAGSTRQAGSAWVLDSGTGYYAGSCRISNGATTIAPVIIADSTGNRELGASNPVTWASNDEVGISAIIELA